MTTSFSDYQTERMKRMFVKISKYVCKFSGVTPSELAGSSREEEVVKTRHVAMYLCREYTVASTVDVAKFFEVSEATVQYACKQTLKALDSGRPSDAWIRHLVQSVLDALEK